LNIATEKLNEVNFLISATIDSSDLDSKINRLAKEASTQMKVDGFRQGKVPVTVVKDRFADKLEFDKKLTFDKVTSVYYSKAMHDEMQVPHLQINDKTQFQSSNIEEYNLSCASFCPAEVYELHIDKQGNKSLRLHSENCVHCKTCDIKAPNGAITWTTPYGGDGPDYSMM
jgi:ferredoxin-like protein FixX